MAQLVIDIGNSRTKVAIFKDRRMVSVDVIERLDIHQLSNYVNNNDIRACIISSVNEEVKEFEDFLKEKINYIRFSARIKNGVDNQYKTPETLGLDRLAGIIGAKSLFPHRDCLVIDSGTCITYDVIDKNGVYNGGSISPGLKMRLKAMNKFTSRLPLVDLVDYKEDEGKDTVTCMLSGVVNGAWYELTGFIDTYKLKHPELQVILCGGDANFFDTRLKSSIFAHTLKTEPNLVLIGLNEVIHQQ